MKKYGLIGKKLGHSWSKQWFDEMFSRQGLADYSYLPYEIPSIEELASLMEKEHLSGFNVTIPYKEQIIPLLDRLDEVADSIGAVNCVEVSGGRLLGHNTDAPAFLDTLRPHLQPYHTSALVLGTGGASKAVCYALGQLGISCHLVSRHPEGHPSAISYQEAEKMAEECYLIINATPVGMFPHTQECPWSHFQSISPKHLCYDLIYNPEQTVFLREADLLGAKTINGLAMLHRQAQLSWEIWNR